jgi:choline-glycine betaine transporter
MTTPAFIILVLLFILVIWIYVEMAKYPGKKAKERGHPQAEAINVLSWVGLLFGAVPWVVALVWAHTNPSGPAVRFAPSTEPSPPSKVQDEEEEPK